MPAKRRQGLDSSILAVLAAAHRQFREHSVAALRAYGQPGAVLYDVKHLFPADTVDGRT